MFSILTTDPDFRSGWGTEDFKFSFCQPFITVPSLPEEMVSWLKDCELRYWVSTNYTCVKYVFVETPDTKNEYTMDGYKISFETEDALLLFKLRW